MSWDAYITSLKTGSGIVEAAICGRQDGGIWATTDMFKGITPDQIKVVCDEPGNGSTVTLAGVKAMVLKSDPDSAVNLLTLVTMKNPQMDQSVPLIIGFSSQACVIALGSPKDNRVAVKVESVTKYLKDLGY